MRSPVLALHQGPTSSFSRQPSHLRAGTAGEMQFPSINEKGSSRFLTETQDGHPKELTKHSLDPLRAEKSRPAG